LPDKPEDLWAALQSLDAENREALFAHCAGLTINAVFEPHTRVSQKRRHAFQLAEALKLDMTQAGSVTRADNYLSRVTRSQIVAAVSEAMGEAKAELLADLKKKEMAIEAERLLNGTGWLPEPRRRERFRNRSVARCWTTWCPCRASKARSRCLIYFDF
jgi:ParB family chromosome partitioning protein